MRTTSLYVAKTSRDSRKAKPTVFAFSCVSIVRRLPAMPSQR